MPETRPSPTSASAPERGDALRSRTFRTLLFSELVSLIGDRLVIVALVALVAVKQRSQLPPLALAGLCRALRLAPAAAVAPVPASLEIGGIHVDAVAVVVLSRHRLPLVSPSSQAA